MGDTVVCYHCGGVGVPYRAKLVCEKCGQIIETCCEGAPGDRVPVQGLAAKDRHGRTAKKVLTAYTSNYWRNGFK